MRGRASEADVSPQMSLFGAAHQYLLDIILRSSVGKDRTLQANSLDKGAR